MEKPEKKVAAALAAIQLYLQQEAEQASLQTETVASVRNSPVESGQWAQSGRVEMMSLRRMLQMRVLSRVR